MNAKEYLSQIKDMNKRVRIQQEYIERLIYSLGIAGISYDKDRVQSSVDGDKFSKVFAQIDEEKQLLDEMIENLVKLRVKIINEIHELEDDNQQQILYLTYVDCESLKKICNIMNFSYQYVKELHGEALVSFESKFLP